MQNICGEYFLYCSTVSLGSPNMKPSSGQVFLKRDAKVRTKPDNSKSCRQVLCLYTDPVGAKY